MPSQLERTIDRFLKRSGPSRYTARDLIAGARGTSTDPRVLAIIGRKESSQGVHSFAPHNAWGWGIHLGPSSNTFPSWQAGARRVAQGLSGNLYKGAGKVTLRDIIMRYAPPSENNTELYIKQVEDWYRSMGGDPKRSVFDQAAGAVAAGSDPVGAGLASRVKGGPGAVTSPEQSGQAVAAQLLADRAERRGGSRFRGAAMAKLIGEVAAEAGAKLEGQPGGRQDDFIRETQLAEGQGGEAAAAALSQKGVPYSWGGGTPAGPGMGFGRGAGIRGFDCSSLVQYAWAKAGVKLPRVTGDQINVGRAINGVKNVRAGDLLFPHRGHVMLAIGNGKAIHAPKTGDVVRVVPLTSRNYIAIRRPAE